MPVRPSSERWVVCDYCWEIVQQSADPRVQMQYHSPMCQIHATSQRGELPAERALGADPGDMAADPLAAGSTVQATAAAQSTSPVDSRHRTPGNRMVRAAARTMRPAAALASLRGRRGKTVLESVLGLLVIAIVFTMAAYLVNGRSAGKTPSAAGAAAVAVTPPVVSSASPRPTARRRSPASSHHPAGGSPVRTPSPAPAAPGAAAPAAPTAPADSVLITFADGTDGWSPFWGSITDTTTTSPAYDGHSLLLATSGDTYTAVGTTTDVAQLRAGDTVTYHVWSSGQPGALRPFIQDDGFVNIFSGSSNAPLPSSAGWFTLTWTIPATSSVKGIGLQVINPGGGSLTLAIGGLSWPRG